VDLAVAGALEFLEDHLVHAAAGVDQRGGNDRQRAAFLDVARRAEETSPKPQTPSNMIIFKFYVKYNIYLIELKNVTSTLKNKNDLRKH